MKIASLLQHSKCFSFYILSHFPFFSIFILYFLHHRLFIELIFICYSLQFLSVLPAYILCSFTFFNMNLPFSYSMFICSFMIFVICKIQDASLISFFFFLPSPIHNQLPTMCSSEKENTTFSDSLYPGFVNNYTFYCNMNFVFRNQNVFLSHVYLILIMINNE